MVNVLETICLRIGICATSAVAASLINGVTVHRLFGLRLDLDVDRIKENKRKEISRLDVIVVDEVSMMTDELLSAIDLALRVCFSSKTRFGGRSVILSGDLFQLPPVLDKKNTAKH